MGRLEPIPFLILLLISGYCSSNVKPCIFRNIKRTYKPMDCYHLNSITKEDLLNGIYHSETTDLTFYNSTISKIPALIFHDFTNLKLLNISNNDIIEIEVGAFLGLENLKHLHLEMNRRLTLINKDNFNGLGNLNGIHLNGNNFEELPGDIFFHTPNITLIDLSQNKLTSLSESIFSGLGNLKFLNLSTNHLKSLPFGIFRGSRYLTELDLSHNLLTNIPIGLLSGLEALKLFNISHNKLTAFEPTSLYSSVGLKQLDVSHNNLSYLDARGFSVLSSTLLSVNLDNNQWKCNTLFNTIRTFRSNRVYVEIGSTVDLNNVHGIYCTTSPPSQTTILNNNSNNNFFVEIIEKIAINNNLMEEMTAAYKNNTNSILQTLLDRGEHSKMTQCTPNWINYANLCLMIIIVIVLIVLCFTYIRNRRRTYIAGSFNPNSSRLLRDKPDQDLQNIYMNSDF